MTIKQILVLAGRELQRFGYSANEAAILLADVLRKQQEELFTHPERKLNKHQIREFNHHLLRRVQGESIAAILGYKEFYGREFFVSPHTLVPRPDTELLVETALEHLQDKERASVLDIGTGTGNIIISLAANQLGKLHKFTATDLSKQALRIAKKNAKMHGVKINFKQSDLFSNIPAEKFDLITANLPYLDSEQMKDKSIQAEPIEALWGGATGTDIYTRMISQLEPYLAAKAVVLLEIDPKQRDYIEHLTMKPDLHISSTSFLKDLGGRDRLAYISKN